MHELEISQETAFLEHNFALPSLRRRIGLLGFAHKIALGGCHPRLSELLPWTKEPSGTKVFRDVRDSLVYFQDTIFKRVCMGYFFITIVFLFAFAKPPVSKRFKAS